MEKQDQKLILNAIESKRQELAEMIDNANTSHGQKMYRHVLEAYSDLYDKVLSGDLIKDVEGKPEKREKKNYAAIGTSGTLGKVERSVIRKTEKVFAESGVYSNTGQLRVDSLTLLELSQEIGEFITWNHTIQTPYAELRLTKISRMCMSSRVINIIPDKR